MLGPSAKSSLGRIRDPSRTPESRVKEARRREAMNGTTTYLQVQATDLFPVFVLLKIITSAGCICLGGVPMALQDLPLQQAQGTMILTDCISSRRKIAETRKEKSYQVSHLHSVPMQSGSDIIILGGF